MAEMEPMNTDMRLGVTAGSDPVWVRVPADGPIRFECGFAGREEAFPKGIAARNIIAGVTARGMAFRKTNLPFVKIEKIRAIVGQEALDALLEKPVRLHVALNTRTAPEGTDVFYAAADRDVLEGNLQQLNTYFSGMPGGLVVAELGAWPLLEERDLMPVEGTALVVDGSASPVSLYVVSQKGLETLRLVSPQTEKNGVLEVLDEIGWLVAEVFTQYPDCRVAFCLGDAADTYREAILRQQAVDARTVSIGQLGDGLSDWRTVRAGGLAVAARNKTGRQLLDFSWGEFSTRDRWKSLLLPWRSAAFLFLFLAGVVFVHEGFRYRTLKTQDNRLQQKIEEVFREALPNVPVVVDPKRQLQQALQSVNVTTSGGALELSQWLAMIQMRTPKDLQVQWRQLHFEKARVELLGEIASYEELSRLQAALRGGDQSLKVEVEDAQLNAENRRIQFKLLVS